MHDKAKVTVNKAEFVACAFFAFAATTNIVGSEPLVVLLIKVTDLFICALLLFPCGGLR